MEVSFLIPYNSDNDQRTKIVNWLHKYYKALFPNAELCFGSSTSKFFSKSQAVNNAAKKATKDFFIILDADIIISPSTIKKSIHALKSYPWVIPYVYLHDIDKVSTQILLNTPPSNFPSEIQSKKRHRTSYGGVNIMDRDTFYKVNGFDERFVGWGGEDDAFMASLCSMAGKPVRFDEVIYHLWHPRAEVGHNPFYSQNLKLAQEYCEAIHDKNKMRQLLKEKENYSINNS